LGANTSVPVDVRLICTSQQAEHISVEPSGFRQKLSGLFKTFVLAVPPLRERREDIPVLAKHFITIHATSENTYSH
jgi:DNA-binding NtrC family response regulator